MYEIKMNINKCNDFTKLKKFIIEQNIKIIFFSETHGMLDEVPIQEEIIKELKPVVYLYELLEDEEIKSSERFNYFLNQFDSERFSVISTFRDLKPVIRLAQKFNLPLIGCDLKDMGRKDRNFKEIEDPLEQEIMKNRELKQLKIIKRSVSKYKGLIFVSLGAFHLRKDSKLVNIFSHKSLIVFPMVDNRMLDEIEAITEKSDIKYKIMYCEDYKDE